MAKAIFRVAKLKTQGNIGGSLAHSFRTRETPNADPARMAMNSFSHSTPGDLAAAIQGRFPEKFRKDAVRCLEYFVGASPEWFSSKENGARYFRDALDWLKKQHGEENLAGWTIHRDEKTPHLIAYVVPRDENGKLNAKKWTGGREKLSKMQTAFAAEVGQKHGLERGIEGSRAKHQTVKQFYAAISQEMKFSGPRIPKIKPAPTGIKRLSPPALQEHIDHLAIALAAWEKRGQALIEVLDAVAARSKLYEQACRERDEAKRTAEGALTRALQADRFDRQRVEAEGKLTRNQWKLREALDALSDARSQVKEIKVELDSAKEELSEQKAKAKELTVGDCAVILGDQWAKEHLPVGGDRLKLSREEAPAEWAAEARAKIEAAARAKSPSPAPHP